MREQATKADLSKGRVHFDNRSEFPLSAVRALNVRYSGISSGRAADVQPNP